MRRAQPDLPPALSIDRRKYVYDQYIASNGKLKVRCGSLFNAGAKKKLPGWRPVVKLIKTIAKLRGQPHAIDASLKQDLRDVVARFEFNERNLAQGDGGVVGVARKARFEATLGHKFSARADAIKEAIRDRRRSHLRQDIELLGGDKTNLAAEVARLKPQTLSCLQMCAPPPPLLQASAALERSMTHRCASGRGSCWIKTSCVARRMCGWTSAARWASRWTEKTKSAARAWTLASTPTPTPSSCARCNLPSCLCKNLPHTLLRRL